MGPLPFPAHTLAPVAIPPDRRPRPCLLEGPFAPNNALRSATRLFEGQVHGSESVAVGPDGTLWLLDRYGHVRLASPTPGAPGGFALHPQPLAYVGPGRPLGFHHDAAGNLVICDSKGLMLLERTDAAAEKGGSGSDPRSGRWRLRCLANWADGRPVNYANDLDIAADGRIFFTDSSVIPPALNAATPRPWYDTMRSYMLTMLHGAPTGRLLAHNPADGSTRQLADGLWFANGCALAPDESFVAVVETCSMRVRRHWLTGPKAGTLDTLIDRLPGWPDNINRSADGNFWLALVLPDVPLAHKILPHPRLRGLYASLPEWILPRKPQWGCVVKVSPSGEVLQVLMDPTGERVSHVSCATEHSGRLFLGNLAKDYVSVLDLPDAGNGQATAAGSAPGAATAAR